MIVQPIIQHSWGWGRRIVSLRPSWALSPKEKPKNSISQLFHLTMCAYVSTSVHVGATFVFLSIYPPHCLFYFSFHCQAGRIFAVFITVYTYTHLGKHACRIDAQQWERRIPVCDLKAFPILFQASQLLCLIYTAPPCEFNFANSHHRKENKSVSSDFVCHCLQREKGK
jgi:hypothetical protein